MGQYMTNTSKILQAVALYSLIAITIYYLSSFQSVGATTDQQQQYRQHPHKNMPSTTTNNHHHHHSTTTDTTSDHHHHHKHHSHSTDSTTDQHKHNNKQNIIPAEQVGINSQQPGYKDWKSQHNLAPLNH